MEDISSIEGSPRKSPPTVLSSPLSSAVRSRSGSRGSQPSRPGSTRQSPVPDILEGVDSTQLPRPVPLSPRIILDGRLLQPSPQRPVSTGAPSPDRASPFRPVPASRSRTASPASIHSSGAGSSPRGPSPPGPPKDARPSRIPRATRPRRSPPVDSSVPEEKAARRSSQPRRRVIQGTQETDPAPPPVGTPVDWTKAVLADQRVCKYTHGGQLGSFRSQNFDFDFS